MADIDVERKGPSIWPWVIGLLVLALLIWAIAEMVDTDEEVAVEEPVEEVTEPPAAVPEPEPAEPGPGARLEDAVDLETLMPLEEDDVGRVVRVDGRVVGQPAETGFWVATETPENDVVWIQAPAFSETGEPIDTGQLESGQTVSVAGAITRIPEGAASQALETTRLRDEPEFEQWNVNREFMVAHDPALQRPPQQPGVQQPMAEDTVDGRY